MIKVIVEGEPLEPAAPVLDANGNPIVPDTLPVELPRKTDPTDPSATVVVAPILPPFPDQAVMQRRR